MPETYDVVIIGGGIAGGALAAVLARGGVAVAVLERDPVPIDRVRGEVMVPWGVAELQRLGLFDTLVAAGGVFPTRNIPYDENLPGEKAHPFTFDLSSVLPGVPDLLCLTHPAMCAALAAAAEAAGATMLRCVTRLVTAHVPTGSQRAVVGTAAELAVLAPVELSGGGDVGRRRKADDRGVSRRLGPESFG